MDLKYIMFQQTMRELVRKVPIIFPSSMVHIEIAELIVNSKILNGIVIPINAGEISLFSGVQCFGDSETLKLNSNSDDAGTIMFYDYRNGME